MTRAFVVMRLGPPVGREVGARIISVASRQATLAAALAEAGWLHREGRCACWIVAPGQRAARIRRRAVRRGAIPIGSTARRDYFAT